MASTPWEPSAGVLISRPNELRDKIAACTPETTHIVCDFDLTLTYAWLPSGERGITSHLLVQSFHKFGDHFKEQSHALYNKYHPIEVDDSISHEDKAAAMVTWWEAAHDLIVQVGGLPCRRCA